VSKKALKVEDTPEFRKLTKQDLTKMRDKIRRHGWNRMWLMMASAKRTTGAFRPCFKGTGVALTADKLKKNPKYYSGKYIVEVRCFVNPRATKHSLTIDGFDSMAVRISGHVHMISERGTLIADPERRMLTINYGIDDLKGNVFKLSVRDVRIMLRFLTGGVVLSDPVGGLSIKSFTRKAKAALRKKKKCACSGYCSSR
jgi:hypothetical protein